MLKGERVCLRPLCEDDVESIYKGTKDEESMYMTGTRKPFTEEEVRDAYKRFMEDPDRRDFAVCTADGTIIGDAAIQEIDRENKKAVFRIALHSNQQFGKGYGTEAVLLLQEYAFEELKLNRLELQVFSHNPRGIRAYEKAGFKKEGVLRQALYLNGTYSDEFIMSILYGEYMERKKKLQ